MQQTVDEVDIVAVLRGRTLLNRGWGQPATAVTGEDGTGPAKVEITCVDEFYP